MLRVFTPVDGTLYCERPLATPEQLDACLNRAHEAWARWRRVPLAERCRMVAAGLDAFAAMGHEVAPELSWQMGRPVRYAPGEVRGFLERGRAMLALAAEGLAPVEVEAGHRFVRRDPLGVVLTVAAWNYPYLIAVNSVVPALLAGNAVILKHSAQTPLCAERMVAAFSELPCGVFQYLHMDHRLTSQAIGDPRVDFVAFTGSVEGGHQVTRAAAERFVGLGLELGGKDPAYVREDADLAQAADDLTDGAFFNSGQCCCAIERIYVHRSRYDEFVAAVVERALRYRLGSPLDPETTLGPMVKIQTADFVRRQVQEALSRGARALIDEAGFPASKPGTPYLAPQVLVGVTHEMEVMREETFGPVVGIMPVASDEEAVRLMNDSPYGLTACVYTRDLEAAERIGSQIETGTFFANRCDYLDPYLAWTGVKDSGRGCALSRLGFEQLTRPRSYHLRPAPALAVTSTGSETA